ncbi:hypothetical protein MRX96_029220 [Rhipicephalus microplus]
MRGADCRKRSSHLEALECRYSPWNSASYKMATTSANESKVRRLCRKPLLLGGKPLVAVVNQRRRRSVMTSMAFFCNRTTEFLVVTVPEDVWGTLVSRQRLLDAQRSDEKCKNICSGMGAEVKPADEVPGVYLVYQRNSCQNDRIPPSTPDTSDEEGSPRKRPACQHYSTSNGSPLALRSECTALSRDPIVSPFVNGSLTASLLPLPTKRLRQSTVPERISPRQSNHVDGSSPHVRNDQPIKHCVIIQSHGHFHLPPNYVRCQSTCKIWRKFAFSRFFSTSSTWARSTLPAPPRSFSEHSRRVLPQYRTSAREPQASRRSTREGPHSYLKKTRHPAFERTISSV